MYIHIRLVDPTPEPCPSKKALQEGLRHIAGLVAFVLVLPSRDRRAGKQADGPCALRSATPMRRSAFACESAATDNPGLCLSCLRWPQEPGSSQNYPVFPPIRPRPTKFRGDLRHKYISNGLCVLRVSFSPVAAVESTSSSRVPVDRCVPGMPKRRTTAAALLWSETDPCANFLAVASASQTL